MCARAKHWPCVKYQIRIVFMFVFYRFAVSLFLIMDGSYLHRSPQSICFNLDAYRNQHFSYRSSIMQYIIENCPATVWEKLIKSCKFFYSKRSFFPVKELFDTPDTKRFKTCKVLSLNDQFVTISMPHRPGKFWIYEIFEQRFPNLEITWAASLLPKIHVCNLTSLTLTQQNLTFDEYLLFIAGDNIKYLALNDVLITLDESSNGPPDIPDGDAFVPFEVIVAKVPKLQHCI